MNFNLILKKLRQENNVTQKELADNLNLDRSTIASYELGNSLPSIETIVKISDFFNVNIDYLLGRVNFKVDFQKLSKRLSNNINFSKVYKKYFSDIEYRDTCELLSKLPSDKVKRINELLDVLLKDDSLI